MVKACFKLISQLDLTENAALVSRRWREAGARFRDDLMRMEVEAQLEGVREFAGGAPADGVRRMSRTACLVEKPAS